MVLSGFGVVACGYEWIRQVMSGYGVIRMVRVGWSDLKSIGLNQFENLGLKYLEV